MSERKGISQKSSKEIIFAIRSATFKLLEEISLGNIPENSSTKEKLCQGLDLINSLFSNHDATKDEIV